MIPFNRPSLVGRELDYIQQAIDTGHLSGDGQFTRKCHAWLEARIGGHGLLTHSCTAALEMAAILADLQPGDEVILPSYTFVSTANAVVLRGATPVFVDVRADTLNIDEQVIESAVTERTRAIIAVHYSGVCAEMDPINDVAKRHGLFVIEDAAQAMLSTYKGRQAGSLSDAAAFSFHETKNLLSGEGGALIVHADSLADRAEVIREKGTNRRQFFRGAVDKYTWVDLGSSYLPSELIAAFLYAQLELAEDTTRRRIEICDTYRAAFHGLAQSGRVTLPTVPQHCGFNGHMFYLLLHDLEDRSQFIAAMKAAGVIAPFHYVPLHSAPAGRKFGRAYGDMTVTDTQSERLVRLPVFRELGNDVLRVIDIALDHLHRSGG
jgi:dTDP-4-amino-4,6-dideoxygalactose transaminase